MLSRFAKFAVYRSARRFSAAAVICLQLSFFGFAQHTALNGERNLPAPPSMTVVAPQHFIAVHGRRALLQGYSTQGLEAWVYPFQILRDYRVSFRMVGASTAIDGRTILSRIDYTPEAITRLYLGPKFIVREKLFVPLDRSGAILTYTIQSKHPIEIEVRAKPVLNLMWPAALGGQSVEWDSTLSSFVLLEPTDGFTAVVGSPQIVAHDPISNATKQGAAGTRIGFTLRPDANGKASVFLALNPPHAADRGSLLHALMRDRESLWAEAAKHYAAFQDSVVQVETPDERVNQALAWAEIALDQAWVCNPRLGCGFVAGFGPSRSQRRPQYDWFFAGDGLIAVDGALAVGDNAKARDELAFILRYQDVRTGMIWHELSQSAGFIDWIHKYPYMYVHVDVTFQFLVAVERYVTETGDLTFANQNWRAIDRAYRYCLSLINPETALPRIPAGKEGANEQDRMSDDLGLSTSWVSASAGFARLAELTGHANEAREATAASQKASAVIPGRYWDAKESFWVDGYTAAGRPILQRRSRPSEAITQRLFTQNEIATLLDDFASAGFQTDWGTRSVGAASKDFDPESYAQGSVWPVGTAALAKAFWSEHRPVIALGVWSTLVSLDTLDSLGHMDEVLDGSDYRPQMESVPEQTWSSAGFVDATIHGLLGLQVNAITHRVVFAPHLPAAWDHLSVEHIDVNGAQVSFVLNRSGMKITLHIENSGEGFGLRFVPELPLGANLERITFRGHPVTGTAESFPEETNARILVKVPHGTSDLEVGYSGGIRIDVPSTIPKLGDESSGVRVINAALNGSQLQIEADVPTGRTSFLELRSKWKLNAGENCSTKQTGSDRVEVTFAGSSLRAGLYRRVHATIDVRR